jgi:putative oxygen-independent coproporphyrinogen III oxidase
VSKDLPDDGALPAWLATSPNAHAGLGVYVHVPFCAVRCGYCDFNTYTAAELGGGASQLSYARTAIAEVELAAARLAAVGRDGPVDTVFFGGGTPTVLPVADLGATLRAVRDAWGLRGGAEVTTEANPDSVDAGGLADLAEAGFTRVSFGMQSAVPRVLATLDRTHDPSRLREVVGWARAAGMEVSLDLIYGTPGETLADWRVSVEAALDCGVDHVSAYALVVEPGTRMAAQVRRGVLPAPDPDDQAAKYEVADELLSAAGLKWYEVSNWARPGAECRHNLGYWRGVDWWGIGPGAHSHVAGGDRALRWWNVRHPRAYADRLDAGLSPAGGREALGPVEVGTERVMLGVRLREGMALGGLGMEAAPGQLLTDGLVDPGAAAEGRLVLTRRGRLLADLVVRALV